MECAGPSGRTSCSSPQACCYAADAGGSCVATAACADDGGTPWECTSNLQCNGLLCCLEATITPAAKCQAYSLATQGPARCGAECTAGRYSLCNGSAPAGAGCLFSGGGLGTCRDARWERAGRAFVVKVCVPD